MKSDYPQPIVVPAGSGKELKFLGVTHKLTDPQTKGAFYLFEFEFDPESGNRLHVHSYEDEIVYVLEGAIEIRLDNQKVQGGEGRVAKLPKKISHALYNPLKTRARYLALAIPVRRNSNVYRYGSPHAHGYMMLYFRSTRSDSAICQRSWVVASAVC